MPAPTPRPRTTYFTGFPSYWNVVAVYLFAFRAEPRVNAVILLALVALVFVRVRYVYPSRTAVLKRHTIALGSVWAVQMLLLLWWIDAPPRWLAWSALAYPAYYFGLSGKQGTSHAWARHVPVFDGSKICERKGRKIGRKAAAI